MSGLTKKQCNPCESGMSTLPAEETDSMLIELGGLSENIFICTAKLNALSNA